MVLIATVGLADPEDPGNVANIRRSLENQVPKSVLKRAKVFHLRGGIDYSQLSFKHRTMMAMLYKKVVKLPENKKTPEVQALIETYNKSVDFVDFSSLTAIAEALV